MQKKTKDCCSLNLLIQQQGWPQRKLVFFVQNIVNTPFPPSLTLELQSPLSVQHKTVAYAMGVEKMIDGVANRARAVVAHPNAIGWHTHLTVPQRIRTAGGRAPMRKRPKEKQLPENHCVRSTRKLPVS